MAKLGRSFGRRRPSRSVALANGLWRWWHPAQCCHEYHQAPIFISGDVHHAQLLRKDCRKKCPSSSSSTTNDLRPLYEVTTSGMTHSWGSTKTSVCGRANFNPVCHFFYYNALLCRFVLDFAHAPASPVQQPGQRKETELYSSH